MAAWSLPTCNRCKKRKKKCDKILPSCLNCTEDGFECVFYDRSTRNNVSRRAVKDLEDKAAKLESELQRLQHAPHSVSTVWSPITGGNPPESESFLSSGSVSREETDPWLFATTTKTTSTATTILHDRSPSIYLKHISLFVGPGSAVDLGVSSAGSIDTDVLEKAYSRTSKLARCSSGLSKADKLDRSVIETSLVRSLIDEYYFPVLHQIYPAIEPPQVEFDVQIQQIPQKKRLFILLTASIAAAHYGRERDQNMQVIASVLRSWADELIHDVLSEQSDDSLQAMVLLIYYELVDPTRKLIWHLLGLACRMCIRLRWHREEESEQLALSAAEQELAIHLPRYISTWRRKLFRILFEWERMVCLALQRPSIFSPDMIDLSSTEESTIRALHMESVLKQKIQNCSKHGCIFECSFGSFADEALSILGNDTLWLSLYLMMQYNWIENEVHEQYKRRWIEPILHAALSRINKMFDLQRQGQIISIWLSCVEVFGAGCTIVDICSQKSTSLVDSNLHQETTKAIRKASSLLAGFSELWEGAKIYRDVFDAASDGVFSSDMAIPDVVQHIS